MLKPEKSFEKLLLLLLCILTSLYPCDAQNGSITVDNEIQQPQDMGNMVAEGRAPSEAQSMLHAPALYNGASCANKSKFIDVVNARPGQIILAPLKICNESEVPSSYAVRLDGQSNPFGLRFRLNGKNLNDKEAEQTFTLPPNSCITAFLQIKPNSNLSNQQQYNHVKLFIQSSNGSCHQDGGGEEEVEDSLLVSIAYSNNGNLNFCGDENAAIKDQPQITVRANELKESRK